MSSTAAEGQQVPAIVAPAPPTGQVAPGVSDGAGTLTREEVDRILAGKGKEVDRERAAREAAVTAREEALAELKAEASKRAEIDASRAADAKTLAEALEAVKVLQERERLRIEADGKQADALIAAWPEADRAVLAGLDPAQRLGVAQLTARRAAETLSQAAAGNVHGGQPRPPALASSEPEDYLAVAAARMAARQMGKPLPKKP